MTGNSRIVGLALVVLALSGCCWFSDKEEELEPAKLVDIESTLDVRKLWSVKLGDDAEFLRVMLRPASDGSQVYAASRDGNVVAVNAESGKQLWRTELEDTLSAGPSVGNGMVAVGSADGMVIVLNTADGTERWRADLDGEVLSPPLITDDYVIVATIDNRLRALRALDGSEAWTIVKQTPALTMRGASRHRRPGRLRQDHADRGADPAADDARLRYAGGCRHYRDRRFR